MSCGGGTARTQAAATAARIVSDESSQRGARNAVSFEPWLSTIRSPRANTALPPPAMWVTKVDSCSSAENSTSAPRQCRATIGPSDSPALSTNAPSGSTTSVAAVHEHFLLRCVSFGKVQPDTFANRRDYGHQATIEAESLGHDALDRALENGCLDQWIQ